MANKKRKSKGVLISFCLAAIMLLTACGRTGDKSTTSTESEPFPTYVESERVSLEGGGENRFGTFQIQNGKIYSGIYSYEEESGTSMERIYTFSTNGEFQEVIELNLGDTNDITRFCVDGEENIYVTALEYESIEGGVSSGNSATRLYKFDSAGALVYQQDMPQLTGRREGSNSIEEIKADDEGRVYALYNGSVFLFQSDGTYDGSVTMEDMPRVLVTGRSGEVFVLCQMQNNKIALERINPVKKVTETAYTEIPSENGREVFWYNDTDLLCIEGDGLYLYRGETEEEGLLFPWLDIDLLSNEVRCVGMTEDGKLLVLANQGSGSGRTTQLVIFVQGTEASELSASGTAGQNDSASNSSQSSAAAAPTVRIQSPGSRKDDDRIVVTIAAVHASDYDEEVIRAFNMTNEQYRVELAEYFTKDNYSFSELDAPRELMSMDVVLGNKGYDIILLDSAIAGPLLDQGYFEDLYPYLDASENLSREDFFSGVLDAYTVDGKLISLPAEVTVKALVGSKADFGGTTGWTLRELLDYWKEHPGKRLFASENVEVIARNLLLYGTDSLVRIENGEVAFDEALCRDLLELLKVQSTPLREPFTSYSIERGESLMFFGSMVNLSDVQYKQADFGSDPIAFVGYPDAEGEVSLVYETPLTKSEYAIDITSDCKEGAWEYIEFYLTYTIENLSTEVFATRKEVFDHRAEERLYKQYKRDSEGNIELDDDGNPVMAFGGSMMRESDDGQVWTFTQGPVTEEEVEQIRELLEMGGVSSTLNYRRNNAVYQIMVEEGASYWTGQKPLDTVVDIIENRLTLYLNEQQ